MSTKILLAEDELTLAHILKLKLTNGGFDVTVVTNGRELIGEFPRKKYHLVITDLIMPDMNCFEALEKLQAKKHHVPILVISNLGQKEDVDKAISLGATEFLIKTNVSINDIVEKAHKMTQ